ncbi:DoxX family protein [Peterkaempfera griseoplana]|uniref:DoxX family protein n=1 Tax=Peterkaempfera griseoplana TaxID=66896 RepID=UPI0006E2063C|nr:DoxX family protein [Peterkaempfera griseoplana]
MANSRFGPQLLSVYRVIIGGLFLCHGAAALFGVLGGSMGTGKAVEVAVWPGWWAALIQFVVGVLVVLGLGTRPAALLGSGSMAYAYFTVHQEHSLLPIQNGGELSVLFCWTLLLLAVTGPGTFAVDTLLSRSRARRVAPVTAVRLPAAAAGVPVAAE